MANVTQFINWCDLRKYQEVILAAIPLYHVYGMVLAMNIGAALGSTVVLIDDPRDINYILGEFESQGVSFFPGVPALFHGINQSERVRNSQINLRTLKVYISGSYPLHVQIKREFEQKSGAKLIEGYGLSEAPTATHCNPLFGKKKKAQSDSRFRMFSAVWLIWKMGVLMSRLVRRVSCLFEAHR
jgi:long-chain acyl-CoA synthetase